MEQYISYNKIIDILDINSGDILIIGSDITRLAMEAARHGEKLDLQQFIESFMAKVGTTGTVLFPTYNWEFCSGGTFDYQNTASLTGALSVAALKRPDFVRTKHPMYSFAVWGKDKEYLYKLDNKSSFGSDSPFGYLHNNKAKMLIIGLDYQHSFTFVHYVEEQLKVHYRYSKEFAAPYIDEQGKTEVKTYSMYVRDLAKGVVTQVNPIGEIMEQRGVSRCRTINQVVFRLVDLAAAYQVIAQDIANNQAKNLFSCQ